MSRARDRASREGISPVKIGTTQLNTDSGDLKITDTSNNLKKVVADEIHIGDDSNKVIIKKGSDNKVQFQTQAAGQAAADSSTGGVTVYANVSTMSAASANAGDLAYVTATKKLYVHNGGGWYSFTNELNTTPVISSPATGLSYKLASDGTATSLEITATDAEPGTTLQYSYAVTSGSIGSTATVTSSATSGGTYSALAASTNTTNRFFKINPSTNSDHAGSFTLTFSATDSLNAATTAQTFSLSFDVSGSVYFDGADEKELVIENSADFDIGTNPFTIEAIIRRVGDGGGSTGGAWEAIFSNNDGNNPMYGLYVDPTSSENKLTFYDGSVIHQTGSGAITDHKWQHVAVQRDSSNNLKMFVDGLEKFSLGSYTTSLSTGGNQLYIAGDEWTNKNWNGYISNLRVVNGSSVYTPTAASGGSSEFDGDDHLEVANFPALGTSNWTIECWFYLDTGYNTRAILQVGGKSGTGALAIMTGASNQIYVTSRGVSSAINTSSGQRHEFTVENDRWYHLAVTNDGTSKVHSLYIDGVLIDTGVRDTAYDFSETTLSVGRTYIYGTAYNHWQGHISNLRITNTKVYTGNFTPPTSPLTAISGTLLLTCQNSSGSITDAGPDSRTITTSGTAPSASTTKPFVNHFTVPNSDLGNITNTKLLALQGLKPKYHTGGSGYTNSRNAYIRVDDASLEVGTGDFTVEFYYKFQTHGYDGYYLMFRYANFHFGYADSGPTRLGYSNGGWNYAPVGVGMNTKQWYHCAMVRTGGNVKVYIDGVEVISGTGGATDNITDGKLEMNGQSSWGATGYGFNGGISHSQLRFSSKAVYTGAFTPPTNLSKTGGTYESTTNVSNPTASETELFTLIRPNAAGLLVDESDNSLTITKSGFTYNQYGAQSAILKDSSNSNHTIKEATTSNSGADTPLGSYATPFDQGNGSIECDDYDNRYIIVKDDKVKLGNGDFCFEYWFYDTGMFGYGTNAPQGEIYEYNGYWSFSSSSYVPFPSSGATSPANGFTMYHNYGSTRTGGAKFDVSNITSGSGWYQTTGNAIINPLTWYHMAIVRHSNEIKLYFNGTYMPFGSTFTNSTDITYDRLAIGGGYAQYAVLTGHVSNFRLVVGSPVYTSNFTPSTTPLGVITNTRLLTAQHSNKIIDASGNCVITPMNGCAPTRLSPF